jgi:hypothetical protein
MPHLTVLDARTRARDTPVGIVDVPHADAAARARFARPGRFPIDALWWHDARPTADPGDALVFSLAEHVGWLAPDPDDADPIDVVKQVSFLRASNTVTLDEFRTHYRHHVEVARRHMPALWQYVQYDVVAIEGSADRVEAATGTVAISVLWFRSTDDFCNRYFASAADAKEFRSHEGFLDLSGAFTFVGTSHPSAGPADRP